jgi:hypothetical protein
MDTAADNLDLSRRRPHRPKPTYSRALICAIALTLITSVLGAGLFHVHRTPQDEATCTVCHVGHVPALAATVSNSVLPEPVAHALLLKTAPVSRASAELSSVSSRAPPAIA